jgi:hypothetical protein
MTYIEWLDSFHHVNFPVLYNPFKLSTFELQHMIATFTVDFDYFSSIANSLQLVLDGMGYFSIICILYMY